MINTSRFSEPITDVSIFLSATPFTQREASISHNFPVLLVSFCQPHLSIETPSLCPETSTFLLNFPWFCCRRQVAENLDTSSQSATLYLASWSLKNPPIWTKKNISQLGSFPQMFKVNAKKKWHHPVFYSKNQPTTPSWKRFFYPTSTTHAKMAAIITINRQPTWCQSGPKILPWRNKKLLTNNWGWWS